MVVVGSCDQYVSLVDETGARICVVCLCSKIEDRTNSAMLTSPPPHFKEPSFHVKPTFVGSPTKKN